ncbi:MAG TPA: BatA domain-containing protein [Thermodesulfobacteriota bacterium]|nr:BatA domain-containing protein [Thermodesulfobacteriota bacterium]
MNLSFLNPLFLIGLLGVALPIIAHLISRRSGTRKRFSAVSFLLASQGDMARRSRIKDLLFLILRSLILVLLVLVFSKPAVFSFSTMGLGSPRSVAIVVDNSFSMGYGDNLKTAKRMAEEFVESLPDGSFGVVFPLVDTGDFKPEPTQDKNRMKEDLKSLRLSYSFTDNERRLDGIFGFLQKVPNERKEVVLFTDLQKNGWNRGDFQREWFLPIDIAHGLDMRNLAVSQVDFEEQGESIKVAVTVSNHSKTRVKGLLSTTYLGDEKVRLSFDIEPGGKGTKEFIFPREGLSQDELPGRVEISHDGLTVDDVRYFVLSRTQGLRVLIVDGDPREDARLSEAYYLARAVETISEIVPIKLRIRDNDAFLKEDLKGYDLVFLANVGDITPEKSREIEGFLKGGGVAVVFPGDRVKGYVYNTLLKVLPAELGTVLDGGFSLIASEASRPLARINEKYGEVEVRRLFKLRAFQSSRVILSSSDGSPFLIRGDVGRGSVFLFASAADTSWSSFPITPVFIPTIKEIFDLSSRTQSQGGNFIVGDPVEIEFYGGASDATVRAPSGESFKVSRENPRFLKTLIPGIYSVEEGGVSYRFSVNTDPRESDLERISLGALSSRGDAASGLVKVFKEVWGYFFWGVITLFISESVLRALFAK